MAYQKKFGQTRNANEKHPSGTLTYDEVSMDQQDIGFKFLMFRHLERINTISQYLHIDRYRKEYINLVDQMKNMMNWYFTEDFKGNLNELNIGFAKKMEGMGKQERLLSEEKMNLEYSKQLLVLLINLMGEQKFLPDSIGISETYW